MFRLAHAAAEVATPLGALSAIDAVLAVEQLRIVTVAPAACAVQCNELRVILELIHQGNKGFHLIELFNKYSVVACCYAGSEGCVDAVEESLVLQIPGVGFAQIATIVLNSLCVVDKACVEFLVA